MRRMCALAATVVVGVVALAGGHVSATPNTSDATTIKVAFFPAAGRYAGIYAAVERGLYDRAGLKVKLISIYGGEDRLASLRAGKVDLILTDAMETVLARARGADIRMIAALETLNSLATVSLASSGITAPADYAGRTFGAKAGGLELKLLPIVAKRNGVDVASVKVRNLDYSALLPSLLRGDVDFVISFWDSGQYAWEQAAKRQGKPLATIRWAHYGLPTYGDVVVTQPSVLHAHGDAVKRFLKATFMGFVYAKAHPDEVPGIVKKHVPTETSDSIRTDWRRGLSLLTDVATRAHGLGWIDAKKLARTRKIATSAFGIDPRGPLGKLYTNDYLPRVDMHVP
jgi:NitT/TauT family transport system substrate-binding protein